MLGFYGAHLPLGWNAAANTALYALWEGLEVTRYRRWITMLRALQAQRQLPSILGAVMEAGGDRWAVCDPASWRDVVAGEAGFLMAQLVLLWVRGW